MVKHLYSKNISPDENESGGNRMLTLLLVISATIAVLYLVLGRSNENVPNPEDKIKQSCGTFHFVKAEPAAEGLIRVYCLDKSGEKKEVLIESGKLK